VRFCAVTKPRHSWALVGLLAATATASYLCRVNVSVTGALMMEEFHLSQARMGQIFSAFLFGYALFQIPGGMLADRIGTPRVLAWASLWWFVASLALTAVGLGSWTAGIETLTALLVLRFILGVGEAPTFPAAARGVSGWIVPQQQGRANGLVLAAIGLGSAIAPPLLSWVMVRWGWRMAVLVSALPALAISLAWFRLRIAREAAAHSGHGTGPFDASASTELPKSNAAEKLPRSRSFVLLTLSYSLLGYVSYLFIFWNYLYLVQERHFDLLQGAWVSSIPWMLATLAIPIGGWISDRLVAGRLGPAWGRKIVPLCGLSMAGIFLALAAASRQAYVAAACLALSTALAHCVEGPYWAQMISNAGTRSGAGGGIMNTGSKVGGLISPVLTPAIAATLGWETALDLAAVLCLAAAALWLGIRPEQKLPAPHPLRPDVAR
jgi:MFS transporter, ACS family, glucarate transporter